MVEFESFPSVNTTKQYNDGMYDHHSIIDIIIEWNKLFECILVHDQKNDFYCFQDLNIHNLFINTHKILAINIPNLSYHHLLSLRRKIMIIFNNNNQFKLIPIANIYHTILDCFAVALHVSYKINKNQSKWFHLHVSKSAGTAIRKTFMHLFDVKYGKDSKFNFGTDKNIPCSKQYNIFNKFLKKGTLYLQREHPMLTFSDDNLFVNDTNDKYFHSPSVCKEFIYILPFREPIERICSMCGEYNQIPVFHRKNVFRKVHDNNYKKTKYKWNLFKFNYNNKLQLCDSKNVKINGVNYRRLSSGIDYANFFNELMNSENNINFNHLSAINSLDEIHHRTDETSTDSRYNLWQFEYPSCYKLSGEKSKFRIFPFELTTHLNESEFVYVVTDSFRINMAWLRTKLASNIYVSWLGYIDHNNFSKTGSYVARSDVNNTYFLNALNVMMKMDYVLPYSKKESKSKLWNVLLNDIYDFHQYVNKQHDMNPDKLTWNINDDFIYYKPLNYEKNKQLYWFTANTAKSTLSEEICEVMDKNERMLLLKYNKLDLELYQIARSIQTVDIQFYDMYHNTKTH